ncbi:MAG: Inactivated superfamily helicase [Proteobacteria bacterium]|nr:Inactivated superfamily helicase [Pseudomonadota bacterium]
MTLATHSISPDRGFLPACAERILDFARPAPHLADLSRTTLLLPNLKLAPALSMALSAAAGGPLLLPRMNTLNGMVEPWLGALNALPDARRQLILHALLRGKEWFDEALLWDVVGELVQLFDTLTEHAVALPDDEGELLARLEAAFELKASESLAFEAKLVNTLWRAEAQGRPSRTAARLLATSQWLAQLDGPLVVVAESKDPGLLQNLLDQAAARVPVLLLRPDRTLAEGALGELLQAAWPLADSAPALHARAGQLGLARVTAARERLRLVSTESLEGLGQAVADQVLDWIRAGRREIALIACDRLAARRARALLEREGVLVQDETGWKMVTTRAAAVVDAWLEVLSSDAYHRALIDLLRAPLLFADLDPLARGRATETIERLVQTSGIVSGLDRLLVAAQGDAEAAALLNRLREARAVMGQQQAVSIAEWLRRLTRSLELLGALPHFKQDIAGREWLEWHATRLAELAGDNTEEGDQDRARFSFASWRTWFNRQMDAHLFRDESIDSPVIMTHLAATRLRSFEAAIIIGADVEHLAPPSAPAWLTHAGVRRELGLPGLELERRQLREDMAGLLLASGHSVIAWQNLRRDEALMPAAEVAVLSATLGLLLGAEDLSGVVEKHVARSVPVRAGLAPQALPAPSVPPPRVPASLSASGMQALLDCPYRYFARYVLRLNEAEELTEGMEKRDFGEQLHAILKTFHTRFPHITGEDPALLLSELEAITEAAFAEAVARNFQDHAWRLRWRARLASYIAWQQEREAAGWRWAAGEEWVEREHELSHGQVLRLHGRIDRRDERAGEGRAAENTECALLDYKSRGIAALRKQVKDPDDVQLAFYSLLRGTRIAETAYVALDDESVGDVAQTEPEERAGALHDCITASFDAIHAGVGLPANGTPGACAYCEMRGLCRKEWVG